MRILILGVTGMLGSAVFRGLASDSRYEVWGTMRDPGGRRFFSEVDHARLIAMTDVLEPDSLVAALHRVNPELVVNCVGLIKQRPAGHDPVNAVLLNAVFPHRLARLTALCNSRLIHISTDCVFSGRTGSYKETDISDATDLYGKSKSLGELSGVPHAVTFRTSIIGHELNSCYALIDWFLSQRGSIKGHARAVFSGLPAVEVAHVLRDVVVPRQELAGLYHLAAKPIAKMELLRLVADVYEKEITIIPDSTVAIDRSLNSERFTRATGYVAPEWPELIKLMRRNKDDTV